MSERFKLIAEECGRVIGFEKPNVPDDYYALQIGEILVVLEPTEVDTEGEGILAMAEVGELASDVPEKVLRMLLGANIGFEFTRGASLGLSPDDNKLLLSKIYSPAVDSGEKLANQLNLFVDVAEYWQSVVVDLQQQPQQSESEVLQPNINMLQV
ncbi:type III secretion system chaperone [Motilimonas pumila]|uniref:Type III secretion system chaperone n=1 Tax=Motilimonas pumila TaxID=2303987 RepID=A0A418YE06_9GAMM|nr:type III secretion system chaperone [Motilimonas pumila]RJG42775.1 hypothetical protein D1Z90_11845 [Motilimonas pumila]